MTILRVIDSETCGIEAPNLDPVEIATVDLVLGEDGAIARGEMWSTLVNPGRPIPPEASAIHHITDDMVKQSPSIGDVREMLAAKAPADYDVAHNNRFEMKALPWLPVTTWLDTYRGALAVWPDAPNHKNQTLRYWLRLKFADDPGPPHRALGDAYCTAAIARRLLLVAGVTVDAWAEQSSMPAMLPRLMFGEHAMKPIAEVPTSYFDWIVNKSKGEWDEDVMYTAKHQLAERRAAQRSRSPV